MAGFFKSLFGKREDAVEALRPVIQETAVGAAGTSDAEPVHVTDELFEEVVLKSRVPTMVDFWAPWCGPCRMIAPIVEDLAQEYEGRAVIAKINTDENLRVADDLGIMGIPTLILFKDGKEVDRVVGFAPRKVLEQKLEAVLN
jgi:thioredoxin 1